MSIGSQDKNAVHDGRSPARGSETRPTGRTMSRNVIIDDAFIKTDAFRERFERQISPEPNTGCWIWDGSYTTFGYGKVYVKTADYRAHRISWSIFRNGANLPSPGVVICHSCDNRWCVNPDHLWPGSQSENMIDAVKKGRMPQAGRRGDRNATAKLTRDEALAIRNSSGMLKLAAEEFGVSVSTIHLIRVGRTWKNL